MAEPYATDAAGLSAALARFLRERCRWAGPFADALGGLGRPAEVIFFGGLLRDLCVYGPASAAPRDVDLVVANIRHDELLAAFRPHLERRTRFGGVQLRLLATELDVWPLEETWAFRHGYIAPPRAEELPRTTFLDVEAVAVVVSISDLAVRAVYEKGFFEAIRRRTAELNLPDNPDTPASIARSLDLASRLGFAVGPRLGKLALHHLRGPERWRVESAHARVNGGAECPSCLFAAWYEALNASEPDATTPPPEGVGPVRDSRTQRRDVSPLEPAQVGTPGPVSEGRKAGKW